MKKFIKIIFVLFLFVAIVVQFIVDLYMISYIINIHNQTYNLSLNDEVIFDELDRLNSKMEGLGRV
jgi:hypothetical protein